ncbi:MAG: DUF3098 domain-containing protein [Sediminibacterium sp.]|nr:DUF3098 domain-containing protein [Sediminibacterium sp.]
MKPQAQTPKKPIETKPIQTPQKNKAPQANFNSKLKNKSLKTNQNVNIFEKENYIWMAIGIVLVLLGMLLMIGGKSTDPNVFNEAEIYSFRRITLAPIVFVLGLVVEFYAIFKKPKNKIVHAPVS